MINMWMYEVSPKMENLQSLYGFFLLAKIMMHPVDGMDFNCVLRKGWFWRTKHWLFTITTKRQQNGSLTTKHVFWNRKFTTRNEEFQATITGTWPTKRLCHHCQQQKEGFTDTSGNGDRISILGWSALYFHQPIHLPSGYLT